MTRITLRQKANTTVGELSSDAWSSQKSFVTKKKNFLRPSIA